MAGKNDNWGVFTISCTIRTCEFCRAMYDLGPSINLMPVVIFEQLVWTSSPNDNEVGHS